MLDKVITFGILVFAALGVLHVRQQIPGSLPEQPSSSSSALTMAARYERGEIWWHENLDDVKVLSNKIRACEQESDMECLFLRFECRVLFMAKIVMHATVHFHHIILLFTGLTVAVGLLVVHRQHAYDAMRAHLVAFYDGLLQPTACQLDPATAGAFADAAEPFSKKWVRLRGAGGGARRAYYRRPLWARRR